MDQQVIDHARQLKASLDSATAQASGAEGATASAQHGFLLNILQYALEEFLQRIGQQG